MEFEMRAHIFKLAAVALLGGLIAGFVVSSGAPSGQGSAMTGRGDVRTLRAGYERWKTAYTREGTGSSFSRFSTPKGDRPDSPGPTARRRSISLTDHSPSWSPDFLTRTASTSG